MMTESGVAYLDTNVFIDAIEGPEAISAPMKALLEAGRAKRGAFVTSELTLAEVLGPSGGQSLPVDLKRAYLDLIVWSGFVDLKPVTRDVLYETASLRQFARLKLLDAIHLATAVRSECRFFVSRDQDFKQLPIGMEKVTSDSPALDGLMEALR